MLAMKIPEMKKIRVKKLSEYKKVMEPVSSYVDVSNIKRIQGKNS
jgi:hypothetical protein